MQPTAQATYGACEGYTKGGRKRLPFKYIENASYTRLRNVTLSYNVAQNILERTKFFHGIRIYAQGQNLYTWTNFTGFDPEDDNNIAGYEYPTPVTFTLGFDLKF